MVNGILIVRRHFTMYHPKILQPPMFFPDSRYIRARKGFVMLPRGIFHRRSSYQREVEHRHFTYNAQAVSSWYFHALSLRDTVGFAKIAHYRNSYTLPNGTVAK